MSADEHIGQQSLSIEDSARELAGMGIDTLRRYALSRTQRLALAEAERERAERDKDKLILENTDLKNKLTLAFRNAKSICKILSGMAFLVLFMQIVFDALP